jgi:hypothetical protein
MGIACVELERLWLKRRKSVLGKRLHPQRIDDHPAIAGFGGFVVPCGTKRILPRADRVDPILLSAHNRRRHEATRSRGELPEQSRAEGIACWFIDADPNEESFFVRNAYFLGANDPYKSLKTTRRSDVNAHAWNSLHSDTSRPFKKPKRGRIAVKVINQLGDEVMKVFAAD